MSNTLRLPTTPTAESSATLLFSDLATAYTAEPIRGRAPFFMASGQEYFWTAEWQRGEAEALREIANGDVRRFSSGEAAVRWLLSND
jgi:hypothetical protein